jgi:ribonuclease PH
MKNILTPSQVKGLKGLKKDLRVSSRDKAYTGEFKRPSGRAVDQLRDISFETGYSMHAEGSCMSKFGNTHVLCTATVEDRLPPFLRNKGHGWITAEYAMLPRSTETRMDREVVRGKQGGRTHEIQRLIGRSLRAVVDLHKLGERQIRIDCDVIQADGGTRTAAISGAYVAMHQAIEQLKKRQLISSWPIHSPVAAVSCGIYREVAVLDLDYAEDSNAQADANFVFTEDGKIVEIQGTAEELPYSFEEFNQMVELAQKGIAELINIQKKALNIGS